jgi:cysteine desulfurase
MIYLDYQATTPLAPEVKAAMLPWLDAFANPHSAHREGRAAAAAVEHARNQVAEGFPAGGRTVFTSGATEALNWAIAGVAAQASPNRRRIVVLATEHAAVLDAADALGRDGFLIERFAVGSDGLIDLDALEAALDDRVALVAAMLVNNEIGVVQPVAAIAAAAHRVGARMLCDAVQGFGRLAITDGPDLIAACAHKLHGPKMIGALWCRDGLRLPALIHGGGQQDGDRAGTLSPMLCVGFGVAAALAMKSRDSGLDHVESLWTAALEALGEGWIVNGSVETRYRGNLNVRRSGLDAARLLSDCREIAFSLGSACGSGSGRPSHVLRALGLPARDVRGAIRLGFGRYTTIDELVEGCTQLRQAALAQSSLPLPADG